MHDAAHLRIDLQPHRPHRHRDGRGGIVVGSSSNDAGQSDTGNGNARRTVTVSRNVTNLEPAGRTQQCDPAGLR